MELDKATLEKKVKILNDEYKRVITQLANYPKAATALHARLRRLQDAINSLEKEIKNLSTH